MLLESRKEKPEKLGIATVANSIASSNVSA
jgi:hypothetical protein